MRKKSYFTLDEGLRLIKAERLGDRWQVSAEGQEASICPECGNRSTLRHSRHDRTLQDLPLQGVAVTLKVRMSRWRCVHQACKRQTFSVQLPKITVPNGRRTERVADLLRLFAHAAGGRPAERLMKRLAIPASDDTILRHLKRQAVATRTKTAPRIIGIDDWSWRKNCSYGTIMVDLERREVVDILADRSTHSTERWLSQHSEIEIVSRDRCGLYAQGARQGASQAKQVADRFHLLQNLRDKIETQLTRTGGSTRPATSDFNNHDEARLPLNCGAKGDPEVAEHQYRSKRANYLTRKAMFEEVKALRAAGASTTRIVNQTGVKAKTVFQWLKLTEPPTRKARTPRLSAASYFHDYLVRRWAEGCTRGRILFQEIKLLGYSGSLSHLQRLLAKWRRPKDAALPLAPIVETTCAIDPKTGWRISPVVGASLCIKPRGLLTPSQAVKVDVLKKASPDFTAMRKLAMQFRGLFRSKNAEKLDSWLNDAEASGIYAMRRFAQTLRQDIDAVRNAVSEPWSNGQTEGQINRLKTLKRAMYGRAHAELLRARMLPLQLDG